MGYYIVMRLFYVIFLCIYFLLSGCRFVSDGVVSSSISDLDVEAQIRGSGLGDRLRSGSVYVVDWRRAKLGWSVGGGVAGHSGGVRLAKGELLVVDGVVARGFFIVDMVSLRVGDGVGDLDFRGVDFFDVDNFPTATLEVDSVEVLGNVDLAGNNVKMRGNLILRDIIKPVVFLAKVDGDGKNLMVSARVLVDRRVYGIGLGNGLIGDEFAVEVGFEAAMKP